MTLPAAGWPRPVPVIGDPSTAALRAADPAGWAFPDSYAEALAEVVAARRDIRRFRSDPVPEGLLAQILGAAHQAPSVGHSQPWRFIVVTDAKRRDEAARMADTERLAQAAQLESHAARRLLDLQLDGIREAPLGIVVCCDRRTSPAGVLGRATFTDSDMWSCAAAIQNAWLTARSLGLGLGWVTLFRPEALAALVNLPAGVETLGWLCLGWPDERPPAPGLERAAWSRRQPLHDVVFRDRWTTESTPAAPPSALRAPDQRRVVAVRDDADELLTPPESLGVLDRAISRILALPGVPPRTGTLVIVAADHPVAAFGVSAYEQRVTGDALRATIAGVSLGATAAATAGLGLEVVDAGVNGGPDAAHDIDADRIDAGLVTDVDAVADGCHPVRACRARDVRGDLVSADALSRPDTLRLLDLGRRVGREAGRRGLVVLGEIGVANTTVAAVLAAYLLGETPASTVGLGAGSDAETVGRKRDVVTRALARAKAALGDQAPSEHIIAALGGPDVAMLTGVTCGAAEVGAGVILDGLLTSVAALLAVRAEPGVAASLVAGQRSRERAHPLILGELGLEPLLDLRTRAGEGVGGCLAAQLLLSGLHIRRRGARTSLSADVTSVREWPVD